MIPLAIGLVGRDGRHADAPRDEPESAAATSRVLVLDERRTFFTFVDVDQQPVPSLLRGFSAPVILSRRTARRASCWSCSATTATRSTAGKPASGWR